MQTMVKNIDIHICCRGIIEENEEFVNAVISAQTELKANPTTDEILYEIGI